MGRPRTKGMVVAKEAFVWVKDARPIEYEQITVTDRKTGQLVTMNSDRVSDPGSLGIPYAFKAYQRVARSHPAVQAKPHMFMDIEELDESELPLVTA